MCLADVNPEAVQARQRTVAQNRLAERVAVYHSDNLDRIPATEQWDLVVGNPPHFVDILPGELRFDDQDWKLHRRFFATIRRFLKPGGIIALLENNRGSTAETFRNMIEAAGLSIVFMHNCKGRRTPYTRTYYFRHRTPGRCCSRLGAAAGAQPRADRFTLSACPHNSLTHSLTTAAILRSEARTGAISTILIGPPEHG